MLILASVSTTPQAIEPTPTYTPDYSYVRDTFPIGLVCSDSEIALGPTWRNMTIGVSTLEEFEAQYGKTNLHYDMQQLDREGYTISLCVKKNIITAIKVGSDLPYLDDYVAIYGAPDAVTYSQVASRVLFWFEEGIAVDVYINTANPDYYGLVSFVIYFPYQETEGYKTRWPYNHTFIEGIFAQDEYVSELQNPFDFDAIMATITAEPSRTPTPTSVPLTTTPTARPVQ
jgi:hypothetical protein